MAAETNPDENVIRLDILRIIASLFWIGGAVLTLIVAIEVYQIDKGNQRNREFTVVD